MVSVFHMPVALGLTVVVGLPVSQVFDLCHGSICCNHVMPGGCGGGGLAGQVGP